MNYSLAVLAGAIQGLTEFLPVSSTGHLIIFEKIFNIPQSDFGLSFDASLHLGTFLAILLFFYKDYFRIFKNKLFHKLIIGTIPAVFFGLLFEKLIENQFRQTWIVAVALITFSLVLFLAEKTAKKVKLGKNTSITNAFIIGLFQALALIPGISRSGATISAGLFLGLKREEAAKFAFLLSGPIIFGAGLEKFLKVITTSGVVSNQINIFIVGIISSGFFGYLTIKYFLKYLSTKNLYPFVIYRIAVGLILFASYINL